MMVDSVSSGQASGILQAAAGGSDIMGKDSFLQLLVTQLKNQDPLQPMDNTQFVAQLAQFSSLEQVQNLNGLMSQNNDLTLSVHNALMTNLIGKVVSVDSDQVYWDGNEASAIEYDVEEPGKVSFEIYDQDGSLVRTVAGEDKLAGTYTFQWDGLDSDGNKAVEGTYKVKAKITDGNGKDSDLHVRVKGKISSVHFAGGNPVLYIGKMAINPSTIIGVYEGGSSADNV